MDAQAGVDGEVGNAVAQASIDEDVRRIKMVFKGYVEPPWIARRRDAQDAQSVRVFRRRLFNTLDSRRAKRMITRIIRDATIMNKTTFQYEDEDEEA